MLAYTKEQATKQKVDSIVTAWKKSNTSLAEIAKNHLQMLEAIRFLTNQLNERKKEK